RIAAPEAASGRSRTSAPWSTPPACAGPRCTSTARASSTPPSRPASSRRSGEGSPTPSRSASRRGSAARSARSSPARPRRSSAPGRASSSSAARSGSRESPRRRCSTRSKTMLIDSRKTTDARGGSRKGSGSIPRPWRRTSSPSPTSPACARASSSATSEAAADTQYRIGSITKTFTAAAIMQLRDAGKLDLEDTLDRHVEGAAHTPTIRRLLSHASGLQRETQDDSWLSLRFAQPDELLETLAQAELVLPSGARFHYSNLAFALLGIVVERVSGVRYQDYVRERLVEPVGR